ncbi:MAG: bifunctional [glutamate--ammonia ligase]-adenylyl-L-tyrosine phosphorylase/[glutamate--ammonia-ligase] adenylyltransferase [Wenzhouxiangellaceae bacterium]|nr:bifunctional [glutamate--ammonia ligase]-adenylyl-L-tyrosine phosphorylase/[glutamate--ammonia-ligase] adenylyltransferase [Wenzhouxiangellaceae bacterium]
MNDRSGQTISPPVFFEAARYAQEVLRRWRLEPEWLDSELPALDPSLPIEARLRRYRQLESLRIQWREMLGRHDIEQTGHQLSALAADCLGQALAQAESLVQERHGHLLDAAGAPSRLTIMALGKLGGDELNFNSDLDLVFVHAAVGQSDGRRALSAGDYFNRVVRELTRLMEQITANGRAWIIDTRLRPFGQAGALVWSIGAVEQYLLNEGRAWERYAWLKARPVAGDLAHGENLLEQISPFVFRRYLDYGLFDSLRKLHADIDQRSRREELQDDIKRGPGGIRELEFWVQSLQLLRGGRERQLQRPGFLPALRAARRRRLVGADEARLIDGCYRFLRVLENRLQLATGRQTHELPSDERVRNQLALLTGFVDWAHLEPRLLEVRKQVRDLFESHFEGPAEPARKNLLPWPPGDELEQQLESLGFEQPARAAAAIEQLDRRVKRRPVSAEARRRLDRLMPELFDKVLEHQPPDTGLVDLLAMIEAIVQRSSYLSLLHERPQTLDRMVRVFRRSDRVAAWITASPQLLDDLLAPVDEPDLPMLPNVQRNEIEASLNALARYRQAGFVRTALGQLDASLDRAAARARLTRLAEAVLEGMAELYLPPDQPQIAMIGYGNLGAAELHYSSDLDLVFLHAEGDPPLRAVQRLINAMQLPMAGGKLYAIDTRLRPNGNAGLLVSTLDSFADYQRRHAWAWEHQALIRARCVVGPKAMARRFDAIRAEVLCRERNPAEVAQALVDMRRRQLSQRGESTEKRLLGDIQFIAEFGVLTGANEASELAAERATIGQLQRLASVGWLDPSSAEALVEIHVQAANLRDRLFLERDCKARLGKSSQNAVAEAWRRVFGDAGAAEKS